RHPLTLKLRPVRNNFGRPFPLRHRAEPSWRTFVGLLTQGSVRKQRWAVAASICRERRFRVTPCTTTARPSGKKELLPAAVDDLRKTQLKRVLGHLSAKPNGTGAVHLSAGPVRSQRDTVLRDDHVPIRRASFRSSTIPRSQMPV